MQNGYEPSTIAADESQVETWLVAFGAGLCNHVNLLPASYGEHKRPVLYYMDYLTSLGQGSLEN